MTVDLYDIHNAKVGTTDLPDRVFGARWKPILVRQALTAQEANARVSLAHAKGRGEVRGGGKKPWRQKGTGRARHGSIRSPIWRGGGVTHGPLTERIFSKKINRKMRQSALFSVLSKKLSDGELKVVDALALSAPKTKIMAGVVRAVGDRASVLLIPRKGNTAIARASANIPKVKSIAPQSLNVHDLLRYRMVIVEQSAVAQIDATYRTGISRA